MSKKPSSSRAKKQSEKQSNKWRSLLLWGLPVLGVIGLGYLLYLGLRDPVPEEVIEGVVDHPHQERDHVDEKIEAGDLPPVGGSHSPVWQNCGIYDEPIAVENGTHSLEHGALWIAYQPELPQEDIETLRDKSRGEAFVLLAPYPGLKSPIVLTAWETQLELDSVVDDRLDEFIDIYQQGPTTPERGASCQDGVGTPIS